MRCNLRSSVLGVDPKATVHRSTFALCWRDAGLDPPPPFPYATDGPLSSDTNYSRLITRFAELRILLFMLSTQDCS